MKDIHYKVSDKFIKSIRKIWNDAFIVYSTAYEDDDQQWTWAALQKIVHKSWKHQLIILRNG